MPSFRSGTVTAVLSERSGLQRVLVEGEPAYVLTRLVGPVTVGDRVVVNVTAVERRLGTGGWHVVHWNLDRDRWSELGPGHVMKLRYTSLQTDTGAAEEAPGYVPPQGLGGMPVVACGLHSQLAGVAAAFKHLAPGRRLVYVMTDGGALPLALSDLVSDLRAAGLLEATVTAGQAFGGDHEAVNVLSALEVARQVVAADAAVVGTGPGVVGTATPHGHSALEVAGIIDLAGRGGGSPVAVLRFSDADARTRHRGPSHHSLTALEFAHERAMVALPSGEPHPDLARHDIVEVEVPDMPTLLAGQGIDARSMGRGAEQDPRFFAYAGAAGALAAALVG